MMHTFIGNLTAAPTTHKTPDGRVSIHLRLACSERYRDSRSGEWKSKEPTFWDAYAWGARAQALADQAWGKGTPVIVVGELVANVWTDQETGQQRRRTNIAIEAAGKNSAIPRRSGAGSPVAPSAPEWAEPQPVAQPEAASLPGVGVVDAASEAGL